jgi:hypothetical protein
MQCYRWKTRACSTGPDVCEYSDRTKFNDGIMATDQSAALFSPGYANLINQDRQTFGHHFFCIYNVSLSCPGKSVVVQSTNSTNWPRDPNPDCQNYVSFSTARNSSRITQQFCGQRNYRAVLESDSFLAVFWTNKYRNNGIFEFRATCDEQEVFFAPSLDTKEGSGDADTLQVREN